MTTLPSVEALITKLSALGIELPPGPIRAGDYGDSPELSAELLALICSGRKRAGTGLLWGYEADGETLPVPGEIEIVVDHNGEPAVVTRFTSVEVMPFHAVSAAYAAIEGEDDGSLEAWQRGHRAYFGRECRRIGRDPAEAMPVVCCIFEVLHVLPSSA